MKQTVHITLKNNEIIHEVKTKALYVGGNDSLLWTRLSFSRRQRSEQQQ